MSGRTGAFLVVWVDQEKQTVDLIPLFTDSVPIFVEEGVAFSDLERHFIDLTLAS
jgi:hypothetical protein